jgi:hypothetical protein
MWTYESSTGLLIDATGKRIWKGYAGHNQGLNNPAMQDVHEVGPLPEGLYSMSAPVDHPRVGKYAIQLIPHEGNQMFGRSEFFMHGDRIGAEGLFLASDGCIVMPRLIRERAYNSGDHVIRVVAIFVQQLTLDMK